MKECIFCDKNKRYINSIIYIGKNWKVYLANNQDYIGRLIITTIEHEEQLCKLNNEKILELFNIINYFEILIRKKLHAYMFNYSCLMNSFANKNKELWHIHIHLIPRYNKEIIINNNIYNDNEFGKHYIPNREIVIPPEDRKYIINLLKTNLII